MDIFKNKRILVTGGTGSFGKKFIKTVLKKYKPAQIIIYSRDEFKQYDFQKEIKSEYLKKVRFFIGDIRDKDRLKLALNGVHCVIHAAALKHVNTAEYNPLEVIKTNIIGAQNIILCSLENNIESILALSTDKACSPANLYGASKLASDKLFINANSMVGNKKCKFSILRYGNVFGSRGSVAPYFKKLVKEKKDLTVTDLNMTRFSITLDEGVNFALMSLKMMMGGELFVPKSPSYKLKDLIRAFGKNKIKIIGMRAGEKIHEDLISKSDSFYTYDLGKLYLIAPNIEVVKWKISLFKKYNKNLKIKKCSEDFSYSSDKNKFFLKVSQLKYLIDKI